MSCDMYCRMEYMDVDEGVWKPVHLDHGAEDVSEKYPVCYHSQDYNVFAFLANVRNCKLMGADIRYGSEYPMNDRPYPKGLPDDLSEEFREALMEKDNFFGEHSFSYMTLQDLMDSNWNEYVMSHLSGASRPLREVLSDFIIKIIMSMKGKKHVYRGLLNDSDIRIVFGFSS